MRIGPKTLLLACLGLFCATCPCRAQEASIDTDRYTAIVMRFADTLMEEGTDRYGKVHSPLFAAALDLKTRSMPTEKPVIPPGPRIREGDRCWRGCNPYLDTLTIRVFYELTRRTGDLKYRRAAEQYLSYYLVHCPSPTTGLLPWGEHAFWNLTTDAVERDIHEFLVWLPLWPEMWDLNAPAVRRAIEGAYAHHVFDKKTGLFNRHASYSNPKKVLHTTKGMPWIKHAGLQAYSLAFLYGKTGEQIYMDRALQMARLYWNTRDDKTGLPIGCIGHSEKPGSGGLAQCESLLAASAVSGRTEFRDMAVTYLKVVAKRAPKAGEGDPGKSWAIGYGSDGGIFRDVQYMLEGYLATGDPDMLRFCEFWARGIVAHDPPPEATAEAYGRAIRFLADLARATGKKVYHDGACRLADAAIERLHHRPSGLFRGMVGYEYYDAQFGIGDLLLGLLQIDDPSSASPAATVSVAIRDPGLPSDAVDIPVRLLLSNMGRAQVSGTLRMELPNGYRTKPEQLDFTVPAATPGPDAWLREPGQAELTVSVSAPKTEKTQDVPVTFVLRGKEPAWEKRTVTELVLFGEGCVLDKPFTPDEHTIALAHFDKSTDADHLGGATWQPTDVKVVPDGGFFGGGARVPRDKSVIALTFPERVPTEGTIEFFVQPDWTSTPTEAPASDGVPRHIFVWAPMTKEAMLWVYFLDEIGAYTGTRVHGRHGKPYLKRDMAFKKGDWHHLALCWKPREDGGLAFIYLIDGVPCRQGVLCRQLPKAIAFGNTLNIGSYPGCPANAIIDEVRVSSTCRYEHGLMLPKRK